ncbi:MAG: hypothetical protein RL296_57 [Actinomycetota bacterium]|jgi:hypothetical protein
MSRKVRLLSAISAVALLLASCGGGDSSSRTRNSALCYVDQAAKDEAVKTAQDAFDAAMGGGTPGDPLTDTTVPATEDSVVNEAPSDTVVTDSTSADGGGYRRPAVRAASSGDSTVPPSLDGGALTPEQQQAQMDLEAAEAQPLCEGDGAVSAEKTCDITLSGPQFGGTSTCEEVVVQIVKAQSPQAIEWQANVGSQVVASGTWDAVSESTKVVTFTYTPEAAQDAASEESTTVTCTGTMSGSAENAVLSDDCPDGFVYSSLSADGMIWVLNKDGNEMGADGAVLASGPLDISGLTPETPVTFKISYDIASQGVSSDTTVADGEDSPCSMTLSSTGISWSCSDGSLFNVAIEDMSNRGVYPLVECASEGSFTVAENQQFWFNFYLINGEQTFLDGYNTDRPQGEPIGFTVPEDTEGVCTQSVEEGIFSSVLPVPGVYGFTADETVRTDLYFATEGECSNENNFAINWYLFNPETEHYEYSSTSYAETMIEEGTLCGYDDGSYYGGDWIAEFVGASEVFASTSVDLTPVERSQIEPVLPELADMPNSYTFDSAFAQYDFVLTEETRVSITVNSNQSCDVSEMNKEENGFTDPEIYLYEGNAPWSESNDNEIADDDNGFHSADNCSAAFFDDILPAGSYFIWAENDDYGSGDTGTLTVNSSVELSQYGFDMGSIEFTTESVTVPHAVTIDVPTGGGHFVATLEASDDSCEMGDPALVVLNLSNYSIIATDDDGGEDVLGLNCLSSLIDIDLAEGKYLLVVSTYEIVFDDYEAGEEGSGTGSVFELKYGFAGSEGSQEQVVVEPSNDPIPPIEVPPTVDLPVEQLKSGSNSTIAVDEGVSTMVCSSTCVDDLFALEGVTGDVLTVSVGSESIVVKRGASKVRVPVSAGAKELVVTQKTASGATEVVSSTKVITAPANLGATSTSTSSESGSNLLMLIVLGLGVLVIAGAGTTLVRRRKAN